MYTFKWHKAFAQHHLSTTLISAVQSMEWRQKRLIKAISSQGHSAAVRSKSAARFSTSLFSLSLDRGTACVDVCGWQSGCQCHLALCVYQHFAIEYLSLISTRLHTLRFLLASAFGKSASFGIVLLHVDTQDKFGFADNWVAGWIDLCQVAVRMENVTIVPGLMAGINSNKLR